MSVDFMNFEVAEPNDLFKTVDHVARYFLGDSGRVVAWVWFRGEPRLKDENGPWELAPKAHRRRMNNGVREHIYSRDDEGQMAMAFLRQAPTRLPNCPGPTEYGLWLCLMQHFGLPTRLLDWTDSLFVAAFFAVEEKEEDDKDGVIWALYPNRLNRLSQQDDERPGAISMLHPGASKQLAYRAVEAVFKGPCQSIPGLHDCGAIAAMPCETDLRMTVQQSRFTIHASRQPLDAVDLPDDSRFLAKIRVLGSAKAPIRHALMQAGIRRSTLFPDLSGLADDLAATHGW